jgi:hypothetical protein
VTSVAAPTWLLAPSASAAVPGYVRLAHLSPDTPKVDVWVTSFRGSRFSKVFPAVGYGALSEYQRLAPGTYTVAMRSPGAAKDSQPLLRTNVTVKGGQAYTVAGIGRNADIELRVLSDDLSSPSKGRARMRVVQASSVAPVVSVSTSEGDVIAENARFPSTTPYAEVPARRWTLEAEPQGSAAAPATTTVAVNAGAIYTVLVLDKGKAGIQLVVRADAAASASAPVGSMDTGMGGLADGGGGGPQVPADQAMWVMLVLGAVAVLTGALHRVRQR